MSDNIEPDIYIPGPDGTPLTGQALRDYLSQPREIPVNLLPVVVPPANGYITVDLRKRG